MADSANIVQKGKNLRRIADSTEIAQTQPTFINKIDLS
jgi:hypothetical protein